MPAAALARRWKAFAPCSGRSTKNGSRVNLNDVILEALQSSHVELKDHGVTARMKLTSTMPPLQAIRNQLYQVIYNLIYNAVEAMSGTTDRDKLLEVTTALHGPDTICRRSGRHGARARPGSNNGNLRSICYNETARDGIGIGYLPHDRRTP